MQEIFEKEKCAIVFHALELVGNVFFLGSRSLDTLRSLQNFVEIHVLTMRRNSEIFRLILKALVSVGEPVSVKDAPLRYNRSALGERERDKYPETVSVLG